MDKADKMNDVQSAAGNPPKDRWLTLITEMLAGVEPRYSLVFVMMNNLAKKRLVVTTMIKAEKSEPKLRNIFLMLRQISVTDPDVAQSAVVDSYLAARLVVLETIGRLPSEGVTPRARAIMYSFVFCALSLPFHETHDHDLDEEDIDRFIAGNPNNMTNDEVEKLDRLINS